MHKILALGVLLVFALSGQAPSRDHPLISTSETGAISAAGTPQVTSVSPKMGTPKVQAVQKPPENPALAAAKKMELIANQIRGLYMSYEKEYFKIKQDPMYQNPNIKPLVDGLMYTHSGFGSMGLIGSEVSPFAQASQRLELEIKQALIANKAN